MICSDSARLRESKAELGEFMFLMIFLHWIMIWSGARKVNRTVRWHLRVCVLWQETAVTSYWLSWPRDGKLNNFFFNYDVIWFMMSFGFSGIFQIVVFCSVGVCGYVMTVVD